jgi:Flp pilus assembly pilin Flp
MHVAEGRLRLRCQATLEQERKKGDSKMKFSHFVKNLHREESGQDLLEYAMVLAAVLAAVVTGSQSLAADITTAISSLNTKITTAISQI